VIDANVVQIGGMTAAEDEVKAEGAKVFLFSNLVI
jgi:hypothetical protein